MAVKGRTYNPFAGAGSTRGGWGDGVGQRAAVADSGPVRIRYSPKELQHLAASVLMLTAAFTFVLPGLAGTDLDLLPRILASFAAVASGFVLHELAHKIVAQRYGHWAEFRAHLPGLAISLAVAAFAKLLFAAPGAVMISGRVTQKENGIISLVGPGTNFLIALVCFPFYALPPFVQATLAPWQEVLGVVAYVNALLCVFNLIPVGPLDGRKVLRWNKLAYAASALAGVGLFILVQVWPL